MKLDTREVIAWNVTDHPTDSWTAQQLRERPLQPGRAPVPAP